MLVVLSASGRKAPLAYDEALRNIGAFARLSGYVRYFHPSDEAAEIDWDRFTVYGVKQVEKARSRRELKEILKRLFLPVAPSVVIYEKDEEVFFSEVSIKPPGAKDLKVVSWQHYGVKTNAPSKVFKSLRVNRTGKEDTGALGNLKGAIEAGTYRGKRFVFSASVKVTEGEARLYFRVERDYGLRGFYEAMENTPITNAEWKTFEIKGKIDEDAHLLNLGCLVRGRGTVYIDEVKLSVEKNGAFVPVKLRNPGFENDETGSKPEHWNRAFKGFECTVTDETAAEGKKSVRIKRFAADGPVRLFDPAPEAGQVVNKPLGAGLFCILPLVLFSKNNITQPAASPTALKHLVTAMAKEAPDSYSFPVSSVHVRYAAIISTWNVLKHFYPYWDIVRTDWNRVLTRSLAEARESKDELSFLYTLRRMISHLRDGQAQVYHPVVKTRSGFPFTVDWIENRVVITVSKDKRFNRGDVILSVDGQNARNLLAYEEKFISGSARWKRTSALITFGWGAAGSKAKLRLLRHGHVLELEAERNFRGRLKEFHRPWLRDMGNGAYYVNLERMWTGDFLKALDKLSPARLVIFDARGAVAPQKRVILGYLTDEPLKSPFFQAPRAQYPDLWMAVYRDEYWMVQPRTPHFTGKVVFLVNHGTVSAGEAFIATAAHYGLGEIVGGRTAGADGNTNRIMAPGGYTVIWTGTRVVNHDHSQFHLKGTTPTIRVQRTIKGVTLGQDELLIKAIRMFNPGNLNKH
jgi:hypothetical protein